VLGGGLGFVFLLGGIDLTGGHAGGEQERRGGGDEGAEVGTAIGVAGHDAFLQMLALGTEAGPRRARNHPLSVRTTRGRWMPKSIRLGLGSGLDRDLPRRRQALRPSFADGGKVLETGEAEDLQELTGRGVQDGAAEFLGAAGDGDEASLEERLDYFRHRRRRGWPQDGALVTGCR